MIESSEPWDSHSSPGCPCLELQHPCVALAGQGAPAGRLGSAWKAEAAMLLQSRRTAGRGGVRGRQWVRRGRAGQGWRRARRERTASSAAVLCSKAQSVREGLRRMSGDLGVHPSTGQGLLVGNGHPVPCRRGSSHRGKPSSKVRGRGSPAQWGLGGGWAGVCSWGLHLRQVASGAPWCLALSKAR